MITRTLENHKLLSITEDPHRARSSRLSDGLFSHLRAAIQAFRNLNSTPSRPASIRNSSDPWALR